MPFIMGHRGDAAAGPAPPGAKGTAPTVQALPLCPCPVPLPLPCPCPSAPGRPDFVLKEGNVFPSLRHGTSVLRRVSAGGAPYALATPRVRDGRWAPGGTWAPGSFLRPRLLCGFDFHRHSADQPGAGRRLRARASSVPWGHLEMCVVITGPLPQGWGCYGHLVGHLQCTGLTPNKKGCAPHVERAEAEELGGTHWQVRETAAGTSRGCRFRRPSSSPQATVAPNAKGDSERIP